MDLETFIQSLFNFVKSCDNAYFVLYATLTCVLTQIVKKLIVNKVNVDVLHKFDVAVVLPFIFGFGFALYDVYTKYGFSFSIDVLSKVAVSTATIGALSSVIFKFVSSLSGQSLKSLLKDDVFGVFYNQLLYFGNVRSQLVNKQLSLSDFISQVKLLSSNATEIYSKQTTPEVKRNKLSKLLQGIVDEQSLATCVNVLADAMEKLTTDKTK